MSKVIKRIILLNLSLLILIFLIGCSSTEGSKNNSDIDQFANEMRARNYKFELKDVGEDFLPTIRKRMVMDKEAIDIYLYNSNKEMENDAKRINIDGCGYDGQGKSIAIDWISRPHFYKKGTIIVQYVGENNKIISDLKEIFVEQFAGDGVNN